MTNEEAIARWKSISGVTSDELVGFFQSFRPHGDGLPEALKNVARSDEILSRLLEIYKATADGYPGDAYFVVRKPAPLSKDNVLLFANSYLKKLQEIGSNVNCDELVQILQRHDKFEVVVGDRPSPSGNNDLETLIDEVVTDFMLSLSPQKSQIMLLRESLYNMTCDRYIRDYILWPIYQDSTTVSEPFESYFELWKHGVSIRFQHNSLGVYIPLLS